MFLVAVCFLFFFLFILLAVSMLRDVSRESVFLLSSPENICKESLRTTYSVLALLTPMEDAILIEL